jgi:hypothetical protein
MSIGRQITVDDLSESPCPRGDVCGGKLVCKCSRRTDNDRYMQRFYYCNECGCRPDDNKRTVPIEQSRRRR